MRFPMRTNLTQNGYNAPKFPSFAHNVRPPYFNQNATRSVAFTKNLNEAFSTPQLAKKLEEKKALPTSTSPGNNSLKMESQPLPPHMRKPLIVIKNAAENSTNEIVKPSKSTARCETINMISDTVLFSDSDNEWSTDEEISKHLVVPVKSPTLFTRFSIFKSQFNDTKSKHHKRALAQQKEAPENVNRDDKLKDFITVPMSIPHPKMKQFKFIRSIRIFSVVEIIELNSPSQFTFHLNKQEIDLMMTTMK